MQNVSCDFMDTSSVILLGFSTAGKSFYLNRIEKEYPNEFSFLDSDKFVSSAHHGHIFNIFMEIGRDAAITYIENKEKEFIQFVTNYNGKPLLIAAGPFLVIRDGWDKLIANKNPFIIHLDKDPDNIYQGLLQRREKQKEILDISNPNFGSWDKDVTTQINNGVYQDISTNAALENIKEHLIRINPIYQNYRHLTVESETLKSDTGKQQEIIDLIIGKLRQNRS